MLHMTDADIIRQLGGPTAVAKILRLDPRSGARRVHNWIARGIPSYMKLAYPHLFLMYRKEVKK